MKPSHPRAKAKLIQTVQEIQSEVRSCEDCGLCCTDLVNTARILPIEAQAIADHLKTLDEARRTELTQRLEQTVQRYQLKLTGAPRRYTCGFLEQDRTCALPFEAKPIVCLSFNPETEDHCDMDAELFHWHHEPVEEANEKAGWPDRRVPIPLAVLKALEGKIPTTTPKPTPKAGPKPSRPPHHRG